MDKLGIAESTYIKWIMKIKEDTIELQITSSEDLKGKTKNLQILKTNVRNKQSCQTNIK